VGRDRTLCRLTAYFGFRAPFAATQTPLTAIVSTGGVEQIVGRERRERVSQLARCGKGCFDSRRRVNSTVRAHRCYRTATGRERVKDSTCVFDPIATAPGSDT